MNVHLREHLRRATRHATFALMAALGAGACGAEARPAPSAGQAVANGPSQASSTASPAADACRGRVAAAQAMLQSVIDANGACAEDRDCVVVAFGASCFDACTRAMSASGQHAYEVAGGDANAKPCAEYAAMGCPKPISPPCAPPMGPTCRAGRCQ